MADPQWNWPRWALQGVVQLMLASHPGAIVGRTIVLEHERQAARRVVHRGRDRESLQGIARVVAHRRRSSVRSIVNEQVVAVVGVGVGLKAESHEAHGHSISGVVRAMVYV